MHSPYFISYICYYFPHLFSVAHMERNYWAIVILCASWHDITKWWFQIKKEPYGGRVQARWLSDTRNGQRQNPVQAHMSIGNMKNQETNTTPFSGACNCNIRIYTDSADLFQDQLDGKSKGKKSNPVRHSRQLVGSIKQEDLSWEHITGMSPQKKVTCLWTENSYSLPSGTRHDASTSWQRTSPVFTLLDCCIISTTSLITSALCLKLLSEDAGNEDNCTMEFIYPRSNSTTSMSNMHIATLAGEATYATQLAGPGSRSWNEDGDFPRQCTCYLKMMLRQHPTMVTCILNGH